MKEFFERDFDAELAKEEEEKVAEETSSPGLSPDEVSKLTSDARNQGHDAGKKEGYQSGIDEANASIEAQHAHALEELNASLGHLSQSYATDIAAIERDMAGILKDACEKIFPGIIENDAENQVLNEIQRVTRNAIGSPWLEIHVPEPLLEKVQENISEITDQLGKSVEVRVLGDGTLTGTSVKSFWQNGRSEYDLNQLCQNIINTISTQ